MATAFSANDNLCPACRYPEYMCKCDNDMVYPSQDVKQTIGKTPMGNLLQFPHALEQVSKVRAYGNKKYPDPNSYKSIPTELLLDATVRHLMQKGNDEETGVTHYASAIMNLLMIIEKDRL